LIRRAISARSPDVSRCEPVNCLVTGEYSVMQLHIQASGPNDSVNQSGVGEIHNGFAFEVFQSGICSGKIEREGETDLYPVCA